MARSARPLVRWSPAEQGYVLVDATTGATLPLADHAAWCAWLEAHRSFAFHSPHGPLSLLKEARQGSGYWYAYRRQGARTRKQYAGRGANLTTAHLEALAEAFGREDGRPVAAPEPEPPAVQPPASRPAAEPTPPSDDLTALRVPLTLAPEPMLVPKLVMPRLPRDLIVREHLLRQLAGASDRALTVVCAPAGFGKTTLVRQWAAAIAAAPPVAGAASTPPVIAWVSLDAGDNDPVRFWRALFTACRALQPDDGAAALAQLCLAPQPTLDLSPLDHALVLFLNALAAGERPGLLILDDYHVITAPRIHETLARLLDSLPPSFALCLVTRQPPPLPLARLRAKGLLDEVGAAELRFTSAETAAVLAQLGVPLSSTALRRLDAQLAGWPAGLRLLTTALHNRRLPVEVDAALDAFAGSQRPLLDFFVSEVLDTQPPRMQEFLLRTSILTRLSAPLSAVVAGVEDSARMLEALEQANLFLETYGDDGVWYRYHTLFAEAMQAEARRRLGSAVLRRLSATASRWYEAHGFLAEAIEAALRAEETHRAAALLEPILSDATFGRIGVRLPAASEFHTLRRWLEQIPDDELSSRPALLMGYATALLFVSFIDNLPPSSTIAAQIAALLERAELGFQAVGNRGGLGRVYAFRALVERQRGALGTAIHWARLALTHLAENEDGWRGTVFGVVGLEALGNGRLNEAEAAFQQAHHLALRTGNRWWARASHAMRSYLLFERGELRQSAARFQHMLAEARADEDRDDVARAQLCLALLAYEYDDLDAATLAATEARELGEHLNSVEIWAQAGILLARIEHAQGQTATALQRLAVIIARLLVQPDVLEAVLAREAHLAQATIRLVSGDLLGVARWEQQRATMAVSPPALLAERELRLVARLRLAQGDHEAALAILATLFPAAEAAGRYRCALELRLLLALVDAAAGRRAVAYERLRTALPEAAAEGFRRLLLDLGPPMQTLLAALAATERTSVLQTYLDELRRAGSASVAPRLDGEQLTPQELKVLGLLAAGLAPAQIAGELVVSLNTVRSQVQSIYRKLGVHNRAAAMVAARERELLG